MSIEHWIWLNELDTDRKTKYRLIEIFGDAEQVYCATRDELDEAGVSASFSAFLAKSRSLSTPARITAYCLRHNIGIISYDDKLYPERLRNIPVPPLVLYTLGKMPSFDSLPAISVVGSRRVGTAEKDLARSFSAGLAQNGMYVVSGMADGIDGMANMGAMDAGTNTAAVLGSGVDVCYPQKNRFIYERILSSGGCIISEYPPGARPEKEHFPERNRIISGLSLGLVVIAAPEKSGANITAGHALEQGRDIFVIPGGIDNPCFEGSNKLIKDGAIPVTTPEDVAGEYRRRYPELFADTAKKPYVPKIHFEKVAAAEKVAQQIKYNEKTAEAVTDPDNEGYDLTRLKSHKPTRNINPIERIFKGNTDKQVKEKEQKPRPAVKPKEEKTTAGRTAVSVPNDLNELEKTVCEAIANGKSLTDEIIEATGIQTGELVVTLTMLTLKGVIEELPGRRFRIKS